MNQPEDRPTPSDRPAPYVDPPDEQRVPPAPGGPPGDPGGEPVEPFAAQPAPPAEPEATWEDVVDPMPTAAPEPASAPQPAGDEPAADDWPEPNRLSRPLTASSASAATVAREEDQDADQYDDSYDEQPVSRWVSLLATIGTALIGIVTVQVVTSLIEGLTLQSGQRVSGVPDDLFHRLGYPFGGLGATALVFLVLGVVLVSMPGVVDELLSESQERLVGVALVVAVVMGMLIAIGSLLAVRANLHLYSAQNQAVPTYIRVQLTNFLLGALGTAALTLFGSIASMSERGRERLG